MGEKKQGLALKVEVDTKELDIAIKKANRLLELLREADDIVDSLAGLKS